MYFSFDDEKHDYASTLKRKFFTDIDIITQSKMALGNLKEALVECMDEPSAPGEVVSVLRHETETDHWATILKLIEWVPRKRFKVINTSGLPLNFYMNDKKSKTKSKPKPKPKTEKKTKKEEKAPHLTDTIRYQLKFESLFYEQIETLVEGEGGPVGLKYGCCLIGASNVLTNQMRSCLNPLVVRVERLRNLPVDVLEKDGICAVYVSYKSIGNEEVKSLAFPLARDIDIDDTRVLFYDKSDVLPLLQALQSTPFVVEICGIRAKSTEILPNVFTEHQFDKFISRPFNIDTVEQMKLMQKSSNSVVVLAVAVFDFSKLLREFPIDEVANCQLQNTTRCPTYNVDFTDQMDGGDSKIRITKVYHPVTGKTPLTAGMLLDECTSLAVKAKIMSPLKNALLELVISPDVFNRIYLETCDKRVLASVLNEVITYNSQFGFEPEGIRVSSPPNSPVTSNRSTSMLDTYMEQLNNSNETVASILSQASRASKASTMCKEDTSKIRLALTGFVIASGALNMIFIEGLLNGYLQRLWNNIMHLASTEAKVLYNSNTIFENRIYGEFLDRDGIYLLRLVKPIESLLVEYQVKLKNNPSVEALNALSKLALCKSEREGGQSCLFPPAGALLLLSRDMGAPWFTPDEALLDHTIRRTSLHNPEEEYLSTEEEAIL